MPQHITAQKDFVLWGPFLFSELPFEKKKILMGKQKHGQWYDVYTDTGHTDTRRLFLVSAPRGSAALKGS